MSVGLQWHRPKLSKHEPATASAEELPTQPYVAELHLIGIVC
jgi:hypothetical protein